MQVLGRLQAAARAAIVLSAAPAAFLLLAALSVEAQAQVAGAPACAQQQAGDPPRTIYACSNGLVMEVEAAAAAGLVPGTTDGSTSLPNGAIYADVPTGEPFQIRTPHAIASVRGTVFAVDVTSTQTSVFVVNGTVEVVSTAGGAAVDLTAGEGVDVAAGATALEVKTWAPARAEALLARLGQ